MKNFMIAAFLILVIACMIPNPVTVDTKTLPGLFPEIRVIEDTTLTPVTASSGSIAFLAIDRQCGSCHHGDRSTNAGALSVFNLTNDCWYCELTLEQQESMRGRISGSSFTDDERKAIVELIADLSRDNENPVH